MSISARPSMLGVHIPPGGVGPRLYWRILVFKVAWVTGTGQVAVQELQFLDAAGSSLVTGGSASASTANGGNVAANAFDGNQATVWESSAVVDATHQQWLQYQFASPVNPAVVRISGWQSTRQDSPADFDVQYSDDGSSWTTLVNFKPSWYASLNVDIKESLSFRLTTGAGYVNWRARINTTQSGAPTSCAGFQMREAVGGADITSTVQQYAMYSDYFSSPFFGHAAFDRNASTFWAANNAPPGNWLGQAFARAIDVREVVWQARPDSNYPQSPSSFTMQGSNDGLNWVNVATLTPAAWTAPGQSQTLAMP